jgi:fatty acid desaturase
MRPIPLPQKLTVLVVVIVPFLATILALGLLWKRAVHWSDFALLAMMYTLVGLGVTAGFHRMLTHRSFRPHPIVNGILLVLGSMAFEGPALKWAATHIKHHAQADRQGDPHSPLEGFFHAHLGWFFSEHDADPHVYCRNLVADPLVVFVSRTFWLWSVLSLLIPFAIGGWTGLLWGDWCACSSRTTSPGASIRCAICLGSVRSRPTIRAATSGWWGCWLLERGGITITMPSRAQPSIACTGGSSISPAISSGRLNGSASRMTSTASPSPHEHGVPLAGRMVYQEERLL